MPEVDGVSAITELARRGVPSRILVLSTYDTDSDVLPAIEAAARGQAVLSPAVATRLMGQLGAPSSDVLSQREIEVLGLVARGRPTGKRPRSCSSARRP